MIMTKRSSYCLRRKWHGWWIGFEQHSNQCFSFYLPFLVFTSWYSKNKTNSDQFKFSSGRQMSILNFRMKWEQYLRRLPEPVQQRNISKSKWTWWRWLENLLWAATLNSGNHFKETSYYTVQVNEHQSLHYKMNLKNQNKREGPNIIPQMRLQREALVCST